MYMSDLMRVELGLPAHMMLAVLLSGASGDRTTINRTKDLLVSAIGETLKGVYPQKKEDSLLRRTQRVHHELVKPYLQEDQTDPRKIGIITYYLLQHLVDTELVIVPEDSSFGKALANMLPALSPWEGSTEQEVEDYENLNRSARKQVRKIIYNLQNEGYYKGIPLPDY